VLEQGTYIKSIVNKFLESDQHKQATTLVHQTAVNEIMQPRVEDTDNEAKSTDQSTSITSYWKYIQFTVSFSKDLEYRNPFLFY
jgi:hypothetical protein